MEIKVKIKQTAGISGINEVCQLFESFAKMYPDVIEGTETDLCNPSEINATGSEYIKNSNELKQTQVNIPELVESNPCGFNYEPNRRNY